MPRPRILAATLLAIVLAGCVRAAEPLPLEVRLSASSETPAAGDTVAFVVDAQGVALLGVTIQYGDSALDQLAMSGARTARVVFRHAYAQAGTYEVLATLTQANAESASASVTVRVR